MTSPRNSSWSMSSRRSTPMCSGPNAVPQEATAVAGQPVPATGGEAAAEVQRHLPVEAAVGQELPGRCGLRAAQLLGVEGSRRGVGRDQPGSLPGLRAVRGAGGPAAVVLVV